MIDSLSVCHGPSLLASSISNTDLPSGIHSVAARSSECERIPGYPFTVGDRTFGLSPSLAGERPFSPPRQPEGDLDTGHDRAFSRSGDPDSYVSFGCVWSGHGPLGGADCRWRREHCGQRGPGGVLWGDVVFEDRSCLCESRW